MNAKRQHYVPRLLLSRFADERGQVLTYDIKERRSFPQAYGNAAAETHFYRVENPDEEPSNEVEAMLAQVEGFAAEAIRRLVDERVWPPSDDDRAAAAALVAFQAVRTRRTRDEISTLADDIMKMEVAIKGKDGLRAAYEAMGESLPDEELDAEWRDWSDFDSWEVRPHHHSHLQIMGEMVREVMAVMFGQRRLGIVRFERRALLTSDHPVAVYADAPEYLGVGLLTATEVWLPVDRRAAIVFLDGWPHDAELPATTATARWINTLVANSARRWIYHHPEDQPMSNLLVEPTYRERVVQGSQDPSEWIRRD